MPERGFKALIPDFDADACFLHSSIADTTRSGSVKNQIHSNCDDFHSLSF